MTLPIKSISGAEIQFSLKKLTAIEKKHVEDHLKLSKLIKIDVAMGFNNQNDEWEEYQFRLDHATPNSSAFYVRLPEELFLPSFLRNKLRVGQEMQLRRISFGEKKHSIVIEVLKQPISWWTEKPGYETLLLTEKIKEMAPLPPPNCDLIAPLPPPNCDLIDPFFDADQKKAIAAAIDDKRPFVTIYGLCDSGKTVVAAEVIKKLVDGGKRVFVHLPNKECVRRILDYCGKRGLNENDYFVLTDDVTVPRNIAQFDAAHPNRLRINELAKNYDSLRARSDLVSQHDDKTIEALNKEFSEHQNTIYQLNDQMKNDIFTSNNIKVIFGLSEASVDRIGNVIKYHRPDVQMFFTTQFADKINVSSILVQAPRAIIIGDPSEAENVDSHLLGKKRMVQQFVDKFYRNEEVCFPLRTRYSTNVAISDCANRVLSCEYFDEIKVAESVKNKGLIEFLESKGIKNDRQKIARELNFSESSLEKLIEHPLLFIDKQNIKTIPDRLFTNVSFKPYPAYDQYYNLGEALLMAKYAAALVRLGFTLEKIGFIVPRLLDAQPSVLSCLLRHKFKLSDEALNILAIGNEYDFLANNWRPREILIRCSPVTKKSMEYELIIRRMAFSLKTASLQHVMIDSESDSLYFKNGMPITGFEQLKIIKDSSLVISPDEILTQEELYAAKSLVESKHSNSRGMSSRNFIVNDFRNSSSGDQKGVNEFDDLLPPFPASDRHKRRMSPAYSKSRVMTPTSTTLGSDSLCSPSETIQWGMHEGKSELELERSKPEFERENDQLRKTNVKLQRERKQDQETIAELRTENQQLNAKIHSLYERILEQKGK